MSVQNLDSINPSIAPYSRQTPNQAGQRNQSAPALSGQNQKTLVSAEYLSAERLTINYSNKDGDSVVLRYESIEYQKAQLLLDANGSKEDWKAIVDKVRDEFMTMQSELIKKFIESMGGKVQEGGEGKEIKAAEVPEYWNAENTSQRIVDFAVSFFGSFKGGGEEYLQIIKDAIDKGFGEAREILGKLPGPVEKLTNDTYDLVMQKLEAWAQENGIRVAEDVSAAAA